MASTVLPRSEAGMANEPPGELVVTMVEPDTHHHLSCIVLSIPPEIEAKIFHHCLPFSPIPLTNEAPLLLVQVCKHWRELALSTPELWTEICLSGRSFKGISLLLPLWLSRARGRPLSIEFDWKDTDWDAVSIAICDAIQPFTYQLERLWICVTVEHLTHMPILRGPLPRVKELLFNVSPVHAMDDASLDSLLQGITVFAESTMLETVRFGTGDVVPVPWTQLKELYLQNFPIEECLQYMQRAYNVTRCSVLPVRSLPHGAADIPALESPLSLISFSNYGSIFFHLDGQMLAALTLPALKELMVSIDVTAFYHSWTAVHLSYRVSA
ncbi:hypothetical protein C8R43DRAFT_1119708 [Mycena crocata]|nr:hypothetical protein C8R43DRAFT_1119708 [Mycena crocata]